VLGDHPDDQLRRVVDRERGLRRCDGRLAVDQRDRQRTAERRRLGVHHMDLVRLRRQLDCLAETRLAL
jgi:hypothetical protein